MLANQILEQFKVTPGTSAIVAVQRVREHIDNQPNPLKYANSFLKRLDIPFIGNQKKAYVFIMTAVEQALNNQTDIASIISKANQRIVSITDMIGPGAFYVEEEYASEKETITSTSRKGSKGEKAKEIYLQFKDSKSEKDIIDLIEVELEVTKQNAYTYLYNVKKKLLK